MTREIEINASDLLMHVHTVLNAVGTYVKSNIHATDAFIEAVTEQGITPKNLTVFQEQRMSQLQTITAVIKDAPWAASHLEAPK